METNEFGDSSFNFNDPYPSLQNQSSNETPDGQEITTKLKRTACVLCRKRKLRCDTARPKCGTCDRLGHDCEYNEVRKKSGPKRGYVKALEARLSQVETQLKTGTNESGASSDKGPSPQGFQASLPGRHASRSPGQAMADFDMPTTTSTEPDMSMPSIEAPTWDMISLGLEEPLPTPEAQAELFDIYFRKIHPTAPMFHKARFYTSLNQAPHMRPPVSLRYAMWTLATGASDAYADMGQHFYRRARKYMELDEMRGYGESIMSLYTCQTAVMLAVYEFKNMHFPRAWLSTGRAVRLSQMLGLHRLDRSGLEVKTCIPPPTDWAEKEERKRVFWMVFWTDRCASIGTGWPMSVDEADIMTNLPASEEAFQAGRPEMTPTLDQALKGQIENVASFASAIMLTALFGRNLLHLHRPSDCEEESNLNGAFWKRHRSIDSMLLTITLNLPNHLRIPQGLPDPNVMFTNMCIHTSVICLHQAAIFKVDKNNLPANIGQESKIRCVTAAAEIANIMRSISHCDLGSLNPFSAFCLYVAARVFVQYLKSRRQDTQILGSLQFLLSAMHALKRKTPLAESFLAQLDVDLEAAGIPTSHENSIESLRKKGFPQFQKGTELHGSKILGAQMNTKNSDFLGTPDVHLREDVSMDFMDAPRGLRIGTEGREFVAQNEASMPIWKTNPTQSLHEIGNLTSSWDNNKAQGAQPSRQTSVDGSVSTVGLQSNRTSSAGMYGLSPSQSESSSERDQQPTANLNSFVNNSGAPASFDDNQPAGFVTFKDYGDGSNGSMPNGGNFAITGASSMTNEQFDALTKQFAQGGGEDWSSGVNLSTGFTPGPSGDGEDWMQLLNNTNWDGSNIGNDAWNQY